MRPTFTASFFFQSRAKRASAKSLAPRGRPVGGGDFSLSGYQIIRYGKYVLSFDEIERLIRVTLVLCMYVRIYACTDGVLYQNTRWND